MLAAKNAGTPYDIVHFDGHGTLDGPKGVLFFENESTTEKSLIDGRQMGEVLDKADVPLLILNACYSGAAPLPGPSLSRPTPNASVASASLAEQVASSAAIDVVAMSHAVYVSTAALIVQDLYRCLDRGHSVGAAVAFARRRWRDGFVEQSPSIGFCIIQHFGCPADSAASADWPEYEKPSRSDDRTPHHPRMQAAFRVDDPFVAADVPLLLLERALRTSPVVQLNGLRGLGKTSLMLELGRWLAASKADDPERIVYVDLGAAANSAEAVANLARTQAGILLIDHADCVHGDALRKRGPWPSQDIDSFVQCLAAKSKQGVQILVAASAPISALGHAERVVVPRLEVEEIRKLVELRTDPETAAQIPEPAILWTAGHPGVVPILLERQATGAFADPAHTLDALAELSLGRFMTTPPPLQQLLPLQLPGGAVLFEPDVGIVWLLMQFQGQAFLFPMLWELAKATGLTSLADQKSRESILENLERSGLVAMLEPENFLLHPLLPCIIASPYHDPKLGTKGYSHSLMLVQGLYGHYIQWLFGGSPFSGEERPPGNAKGWDFHNLLHAFRCLAGELQIEHMGALSLARQLRARFFAMNLPEYWTNVLQKLKEAFERTAPPPDDGQFNPGTEMTLLLMEEADRNGDRAAVAKLAKKALEVALLLPGPGPGLPQSNAYDVYLKIGRLVADIDMKEALTGFNMALKLAGEDPLRKAYVQLELTRLLRKLGTPADLLAARTHGESALALFVELVKSKICDLERVVLITMSLSLVYQDLLRTPNPDPAWRKRGEDLCRESLSLSEEPIHQATAWYNLGNWRRSAGDFEEAAGAYLEAANIYEQLKDELMLGYSLAFRADCVLERQDFVGARLDAMRAATLLAKQPNASKEVLLLAYKVGEQAWSQITVRPS
jgi:tetratricopeptide (TPR) repeat protein